MASTTYAKVRSDMSGVLRVDASGQVVRSRWVTVLLSPASTGRNPQTGEPVEVATSTAMRFSPSSLLTQALNTTKQ